MTLDEAHHFMECAKARGTNIYVWWAGEGTGFLSTIHVTMIPPGVAYTTFNPDAGTRHTTGPE